MKSGQGGGTGPWGQYETPGMLGFQPKKPKENIWVSDQAWTRRCKCMCPNPCWMKRNGGEDSTDSEDREMRKWC